MVNTKSEFVPVDPHASSENKSGHVTKVASYHLPRRNTNTPIVIPTYYYEHKG